ncbi:NAD-dependent epimerase/dehydratase family protein [Stenotrophomonas rhizophila]|uniref:NAD-dependent epimerase/dehydratase family protein n=1 Tax=Stenotrophomonas rhizophila TaxID=216778 RepID=UPI001E3C8F19|nr:NAD(P)-dependent oxidoreductase [Stenotrophomonas rhizophila]MCC7633628.1 NAD(P)-dependent oxidoreductase [Stenotrophomonas rhizophila]MCC7663574.1 NAD(P)-dependent oxidoreductase [Stenotrophomonas rhizophila]
MTDPSKKTVLLTGAAGRIGTAFRQLSADRFTLRLADLDISSLGGDGDVLELDIADLDACRKACEGVDTVLHLAADPGPVSDFYGSLLDANIKGAFNIFRAAADAGCRRVVFASSAQTIEGYPEDRQVSVDDPVRPKNIYGVTKCFGEALGSYFASQEGLSVIAVRIANFASFTRGESHSARDVSAFLSHRDAVQLLVRAVEAEHVDFAIVNGISNNRYKRLNLEESQRVLGYAPQDDAFEILGL